MYYLASAITVRLALFFSIRSVIMDGLPPQEQIQSSLWSLVPAAGDGKRLQPNIRGSRGTELAKQYVNFVGRRSTLEHSHQRPEMLIPAHRTLTIVSQQHLRYREVQWQLRNRNAARVIVQPANKEPPLGFICLCCIFTNATPKPSSRCFRRIISSFEEARFMD